MTNPTDPTAPQEPRRRPAHAWVDPMPSTTQTPYSSGGQNIGTDMGSNQLPSTTHTPYVSGAEAHAVDSGASGYWPPAGPYPAEAHTPKRRRSSNRPLIIIAIVAALAIIGTTVAATLAAINSDDGSVPVILQQKSTALDDAVKACSQAGLLGVEVTDGGKSLIVDSQGEEEPYGASIQTLDCLLNELKTPQSVIAEIQSTRALDGRQEADWGRFHGSWTYHPDDGLDIIITTS